MSLTFGSLFAGIGGFDLGFERAGMQCKWQVEIDDYATKVLAKHWPLVHRERDVRECGRHNLERVDVICGGFPCQDISYAGAGAGLDGERSGLFFEAIRVVRELQPRIVVLENVAALLTRGLDRVLGTLAEIGYDAEWHCIPAAAVGAPHVRDRAFVLGYTTGFRDSERGFSYQGTDSTGTSRAQRFNESGRDGIFPNPLRTEFEPRTGRRGIREGDKELADTDEPRLQRWPGPEHAEKSRSGPGELIAGQCEPRKRSHWAVEPNVGRVANGVSKRMDRLRGLGNAVVPQVAEYIGRRITDVESNKLTH